ncbi:ribbon-helix-helix protein, CopG family [bacterium]|nr:ribbon-helix-helix protein, CopG family [bacterium]MBU3954939.1 ribbon-helix-helix protein, CopG family [bacterium]
MRNVLSISLPNKLLAKLVQESKEENASRSEIVRKSLQQHFFVRELTKLRDNAISELARKGIVVSEEQIFKTIS